MQTSGEYAARTRNCTHVIASVAKQSIEQRKRRNGLLRYARNDVEGPVPASGLPAMSG
jgi:phosphoenolpyruvate carboxylase